MPLPAAKYRDRSFSTPHGIRRITPKQQMAIDAIVFRGLRVSEVVKETGLSEPTVYRALANPAGRRYYDEQLEVLRSGERARNLHVATEIREDPVRNPGKTRIEAMKFIEGSHLRDRGVTVNVGVGVQLAPGYIVDSSEHMARAKQILQQSGSVRTLLDKKDDT